MSSVIMLALVCCGESCQHIDADDNALCDNCGEDYTDGKDDVCVHSDSNADAICDVCVEAIDTSDFGYYLAENEKEYIIVSYVGTSPVVTIPSTINGLPVTGIALLATSNDIVSVTIPETITHID